MNSSISQSENPIENIFFELGKGEKGKFDIFVQRHNDRIPTDNDVPFKIQLLKDGKLIEEETKIMNKIRQNIFVMSFEIP